MTATFPAPSLAAQKRIVYWFSCGTASAVNTMLGLAKHRGNLDIRVVRCVVPEEHPDNDRFSADCERWFDWPIENLRSADYESCEDVWTRRRYMSGPNGATCTLEMKKRVRQELEQSWWPDLQGFGYTAEETRRAARFQKSNPDVRLVSHLIEDGLKKEDCHAIVERAGIKRSAMYDLGFPNANCRGCVNAQSPGYWNLTRRVFPDVWERRNALSRELGVRLIKLTSGTRERVYLDEVDPNVGLDGSLPPMPECSLLCYAAENTIATPPATLERLAADTGRE